MIPVLNEVVDQPRWCDGLTASSTGIRNANWLSRTLGSAVGLAANDLAPKVHV
jgi:hypothetical protein